MDTGMPWTQFDVDSVDDEYERLLNLGVEFSIKPSIFGTMKYTVFDNTWGNNIEIVTNL